MESLRIEIRVRCRHAIGGRKLLEVVIGHERLRFHSMKSVI